MPSADEPTQGRHLPHDAGVVRGVRGGRDESGQLVDPDLAARILELASLLELVDERDRVDRLTARIEPKPGPVDLRVALAIEVGRREHLADRPDRAGGEHHRA